MNKIFKLFLALAFVVTGANAVEKERNGGPYIGLNYGLSSYNDNSFYDSIKDKEMNSYGFCGGAYINRYLSVELNYMKSGDFKVVDSVSNKTSFNYSAVTVNALAHYPLWYDALDLYAKFGAGQSYTSISSADGSALVVGGGVSYRLDEMFALKVAYDMYSFNYESSTRGKFDMDIQYAYAGIEVQF